MHAQPPRPTVLFMYLGRLGALGRFTLELAEAARNFPDLNAHFVISPDNEMAEAMGRQSRKLHMIDTFARPTPFALATGYPRARRQLGRILDAVEPQILVNLMPHVWSPLLARGVAKRGIAFMPVIHDAVPHPGDPTARLTRWLLGDIRNARTVLTLSHAVARTLVDRHYAESKNISVLFHPDLTFGTRAAPRVRPAGEPLRLLFFGRIMAYKGLDVLVEAVSLLKRGGLPVTLGVAGSGEIGAHTRAALDRLDAEVINRWVGDSEISGILARYDAIACPHTEASQSGVAAVAFGHAMPVVAMPSGGIVEQVREGETGVLASEISARALADAIARLARDPGLYTAISRHIADTAGQRSMLAFLRAIASLTP